MVGKEKDYLEKSSEGADVPNYFAEYVKNLASSSLVPVSKEIEIVSDGKTQKLNVTRKGFGILNTDYGKFFEFDFSINDKWNKYSVLVRAETELDSNYNPVFTLNTPLLIRIDSGCETGQVFGDRTCECKEQLELAMEDIKNAKEGVIIHIPFQDARGLGLPFKLATLTLQDALRMDTVEAAELLTKHGNIDTRTYSGVVGILKFFGLEENTKVNLATNNPRKANIFTENGYEISTFIPMLIPPTELTQKHLKAKQDKLGHIDLVRKSEEVIKERNFFNLLEMAVTKNKSLVCCGLDPDITKVPQEIIPSFNLWRAPFVEEKMLDFLKTVVDITGPHVCAYKLQKAFFETFNSGKKLMADTITYIKTKQPLVPIIIDAKIGDIDNTMNAYLQTAFSRLGADAVVVNPYMGEDVIFPFKALPNKAAVVLVKTSNIGSRVVQDIKTSSGNPLWIDILNLVVKDWNTSKNLIPVISSTAGIDFGTIRKIIPDETPILLAGVGAQGGDLANLRELLNSRKRGVIINSSRYIVYPYEKGSSNWRSSIEDSVIKLKTYINSFRETDDH